jgi:hypothetical protein
MYRSTLFSSVSRRAFGSHSPNEFLTRLHLITYSNYCHITSRRDFWIERIVLRTFTSSKSLIKALDPLDISSPTAKQYSFKRRWLTFDQCENNFWVIDSNKSTSSKSWVISLRRMQSKPAEDLCVVESGETMTHTSPRLKRITLGKREGLYLFLDTPGTPRIFSLFLTNIGDAQASPCQEIPHVYKEGQTSPFLEKSSRRNLINLILLRSS